MEKERRKCGIGWFKKKDSVEYILLVINHKKYAVFYNKLDDNKNKFDFIVYESAPREQRGTGKQGIGWKLRLKDKFGAVIKIKNQQYFIVTNKLKSESSTFDLVVYPYIDKKRKEV